MYPKISVNLGNLVLSLSDALDLAFSSLAMHQQRTAFIAWELGKQAKLEGKRLEHVFIAGLLHDIGALSIEQKNLFMTTKPRRWNHTAFEGSIFSNLTRGLHHAQTWCGTTTGNGLLVKSREMLPRYSTRNFSFSRTTWNDRLIEKHIFCTRTRCSATD